jgi:DHA2 family multidrug resistance protein
MACLALIFITGAIASSGSVMLAPMLQQLFGYPVIAAGYLMIPRAAGMLAPVMLASVLYRHFDARLLILAGMAVVAVSLWMMTGFNLQMDSGLIISSGLLQGFGLGLISMPLNILSVSTLDAKVRTDGAALYQLIRNIGGSIAIAIVSALLARNIPVNHAELGGLLTSGRFPFLMPGLPHGAGSEILLSFADLEISRQAMMIGYVDDYWLLMWATIAMMPFVLILRSPPPPSKDEAIPLGE